VNVTVAHRIRLRRLDQERPVQPGDLVLVDLGHAHDVTTAQMWRLRALVTGAARVELHGSTRKLRDQIADFLHRNADTMAEL